MRVEFTDSAKADLKDLRAYLLRYNPKGTWELVKKQIQERIDYIAKYPDSGSIPQELQDYPDGFRQILTNQQRIIYRVTPDIIFIHVICGQVQDFTELLIKKLTRP